MKSIPKTTSKIEAIRVDFKLEDTRPTHVKDQTIDLMLEGYSVAGTRFLDNAYYHGNGIFEGNFSMERHFYYGNSDELFHLTEVEASIAFNQLVYVSFAHLLESRAVPALGVMSPAEFLVYQTHGSWIRKSTYEYNKPINLRKSEGRFTGLLKINELSFVERENDKSVKYVIDLSFEGGKCNAWRDTRLILPKQ